jgi:hypothetical protein
MTASPGQGGAVFPANRAIYLEIAKIKEIKKIFLFILSISV